MKRPTRTVRRESIITYRGRQIILHVPPTADSVTVHEKGRRSKFDIDIITIYHVAVKQAALVRLAGKAKRGKR
jgi:hypothetical protein